MFSANFRFDENQTTIKFPCDEEYLSVRFNELGVADKLKTSTNAIIKQVKPFNNFFIATPKKYILC